VNKTERYDRVPTASQSRILVLLLLLLFGFQSLAGTVHYRWINERGEPVYSDRPPPKGTEYEVVSTDSSLVRRVDAETGAVPRKIEPTVTNDFEPVDTRADVVEKNPEYCARAQENLRLIDISPRIKLRNDQGEVRFLDDDERAVERQKAEEAIEAYCE
jgi:hypothetical protein